MTVGIVGLGLIGGSIALDLLARGEQVVASDPDPATCRAATAAGITVVVDPTAVAAAAESVVVATPPGVVAEVVAMVAAADVTVTDVASIRRPSALGFDGALPARWVGSHPMAGTERSGFAAARRGLLVGAPWLLTPHDGSGMRDVAAVADLALRLDARPAVVAPEFHDSVVATTSHLPHLLAFALQAAGGALGRDVVDAMAGPSFRDATRVAASPPEFWADLLERNRDAVTEALDGLREWLGTTMSLDRGELVARLDGARRRPGRHRHEGEQETVVLDDPAAALQRLRDAGRRGRFVRQVATVEGRPTLVLSPE